MSNIFIKEHDYLDKKISSLNKFTSRQEKNALLIDDDAPVFDVLKELTDIEAINEGEAEILLLKLRENSVTDIVEYIITCGDCKSMTDFNVSVNEFINLEDDFYINLEEGTFLIPKGHFIIDDIINKTYIENSSIKIIKHIEDIIEQQNMSIHCDVTKKCRKCSKEIELDIIPREHFSKSSVSTIYQDYMDITLFSNNGFNDIDNLYPFERDIYISLLKEHLNDKKGP